MKLTEKSVSALRAPATGYLLTYDSGHDKAVSGFGVRTMASGSRSFVFDYRFHGRTARITIGKLGAWTALAARQRAVELKRLVDQGRDPMRERNDDRHAPLMGELFDRYLAEHALPKKKLSSVAEDWGLVHGGRFRYDAKAGTLGKADKPFAGTLGSFFGKMQVKDVSRGDAMKFHGSLRATPYRANRALALLSKVMNLAELWDLRPDNSNPCRHVEKYEEKARTRYLKPDELAKLSVALTGADDLVATAIKLLLFTGCRVSEIIGLRWEHIDMKAGIAHLKDAKAGERDVQLSTDALTLLSKLPTSEGPILGGLTYDMLDKAWRRIRKDAGLVGVRLHDARHTVGTYAGMSGANSFLVRDLLGHRTLAMTDRYVSRDADPVKQVSDRVSNQIAAALRGKTAEVIKHPRSTRRS
jgi:integrase